MISLINKSVATMVTVGFGDIYPINNSEKIYVVFVMLLACGLFAYIMNLIGEQLLTMEKFNDEYKQQMNQIN
jgi:hypothetical protein